MQVIAEGSEAQVPIVPTFLRGLFYGFDSDILEWIHNQNDPYSAIRTVSKYIFLLSKLMDSVHDKIPTHLAEPDTDERTYNLSEILRQLLYSPPSSDNWDFPADVQSFKDELVSKVLKGQEWKLEPLLWGVAGEFGRMKTGGQANIAIMRMVGSYVEGEEIADHGMLGIAIGYGSTHVAGNPPKYIQSLSLTELKERVDSDMEMITDAYASLAFAKGVFPVNTPSVQAAQGYIAMREARIVAEYLHWALKNPTDPRSAIILRKLAETYSNPAHFSNLQNEKLQRHLAKLFGSKALKDGLKNLNAALTPVPSVSPALKPDAVFMPGQNYDGSLVGAFNSEGKAVGAIVPQAAFTLEDSIQKLKDGDEIADVPDNFLYEAVKANTGEGKRFKVIVDPQASGFNGAPLIVADTLHPSGDPDNPIYPRYVIKDAHRNPQEHMAQRTANYVADALGIPVMGVRFAGEPETKTDKNGNQSLQRRFLMEHAQNIFLGPEWDLTEERVAELPSSEAVSERFMPEPLARLIVLNRVLNHYDRTDENTRIVRTLATDDNPNQEIYILPIDDGNALQPWKKGNTTTEQQAGFSSAGKGVGRAWLSVAKGMSKQKKIAVAAEMRRAITRYLEMDTGQMLKDLDDPNLLPEEKAKLLEHINFLEDRKTSLNWESMFQAALEELGITEEEVNSFDQQASLSQILRFATQPTANSPQTVQQNINKLSSRNLGMMFRWGGADVDQSQIVMGDVQLEDIPGTDGSPVAALYGSFRLAGEAKEVIGSLVEEEGWEIVKLDDGSVLTEPVLPTYRTKTKNMSFTRRLSYGSWSTRERPKTTGGQGVTYRKVLDDGTEVYVHIASGGKKNSYYGHAMVIMPTESEDKTVLAVSNVSEKLSAAGSALGISNPVTQSPEQYREYAIRELADAILTGEVSDLDTKSIDELLALIGEKGFSIGDVEVATDVDGTPYVRLTKSAVRRILSQRSVRAMRHEIKASTGYTYEQGLLGILRSGAIGSAVRRYRSGIDHHGLSTQGDVSHGGSNSIFMYSDITKDTPTLSLDDDFELPTSSSGSYYSFIVPAEFVIERIDTKISSSGDNWGDIDQLSNYLEGLYGGRQIYVRGALPISRSLLVIGESAELSRQQIIDRLKAQGIERFDGVPIEMIITTKSNAPQAWKALVAYWKTIGWA